MKYKTIYFNTISKKLKHKLKKRFIRKDDESYMCNQLDGNRDIRGAVVAFSKSGYIIGWSSLDVWKKSCFINTFVSRRYRGKGIATDIIKQCMTKQPGMNYFVVDVDNIWISIELSEVNRTRIRKICSGSANKL